MTSLGRGLGSLIPQKAPAQSNNVENSNNLVKEVSLDLVSANPMQPRKVFNQEKIDELVDSIREYGILQPLIVTEKDDGKYEIVAGERRYRASKILKLKTIPVIVRNAQELEKLELALIENIQRQDLNPIETAEAYQKLIKEFGLTQEQAAKRMGKTRSSVANSVRLLTLPGEIQKVVAEGKISEGHAKVLLSLTPSEQQRAFQQVVKQNLSVRDLERLSSTKKRKVIDPNIKAQEEQLRAALGTKVAITKRGKGGRVTIDTFSDEELDGVIKQIIN